MTSSISSCFANRTTVVDVITVVSILVMPVFNGKKVQALTVLCSVLRNWSLAIEISSSSVGNIPSIKVFHVPCSFLNKISLVDLATSLRCSTILTTMVVVDGYQT